MLEQRLQSSNNASVNEKQARLCGVDLDVELEFERKWGACREEAEGDSRERTTPAEIASRNRASEVAAAEMPPAVFLQDKLELEQLYGKKIINGDGYFLPRSWVFAQSNEIRFAANQDDNSESVSATTVHTFARNQDGESICHDKHPFVACVHLL